MCVYCVEEEDKEPGCIKATKWKKDVSLLFVSARPVEEETQLHKWLFGAEDERDGEWRRRRQCTLSCSVRVGGKIGLKVPCVNQSKTRIFMLDDKANWV